MASIIPFRPRVEFPPGAADLAGARKPSVPYSAINSRRFDALFDPVAFNDALYPMDERLRRRLLYPAFEREQGKCFWCERPTSIEARETLSTCHPDQAAATVDHIVPRSKRGGNTLGNVVLSCFSCNGERGNKDAEGFLYERQLDAVREVLE